MAAMGKGKQSTARLQAKTVANAYRHGMTWDDDEVGILVNGITSDATTFDIAMSLGRSYYSIMGARTHVRFALDHAAVLLKVVTPQRVKKNAG